MDRIQKNIIRNIKGGIRDDYNEKEEEGNKVVYKVKKVIRKAKKESCKTISKQQNQTKKQNQSPERE